MPDIILCPVEVLSTNPWPFPSTKSSITSPGCAGQVSLRESSDRRLSKDDGFQDIV